MSNLQCILHDHCGCLWNPFCTMRLFSYSNNVLHFSAQTHSCVLVESLACRQYFKQPFEWNFKKITTSNIKLHTEMIFCYTKLIKCITFIRMFIVWCEKFELHKDLPQAKCLRNEISEWRNFEKYFLPANPLKVPPYKRKHLSLLFFFKRQRHL